LYSYSLLLYYYSVQMQNHFSSSSYYSLLFNAEISSVNSSDNTLRNHFDFKDYEGIFKVQLTWKESCFYQLLGIMVSTLYCRIFHRKIIQNSKTMIRLYLWWSIWWWYCHRKTVLDKKNSLPIFQASAVPKEIYSGSLPTTIVLDKYE
jgi:hypothetical protein